MSTDQHLNNLFDAARNAAPLLTEADIAFKLEANGNDTPKKLKFFNLKIILLMSALIILFTGLYFWHPTSLSNIDAKPIPSKISISPIHKNIARISPSSTAIKSYAKTNSKTVVTPALTFAGQTSVGANSTYSTISNVNPSPEFLEALPNDKIPVAEQTPQTNQTSNRNIDLQNTKVIELTPEELKKFGITINDKTIYVYSGAKAEKSKVKSKPFYLGYNKSGTTITFNASVIDTSKNKNAYKMKLGDDWISIDNSSFDSAPDTILELPHKLLVTDDLGQTWRTYSKDDQLTEEEWKYVRKNNINVDTWDVYLNRIKEGDRKLSANLPSYIPILVRSGDVNLPDDNEKKRWRADIIIWYEPSEALFNALPPRIGNELRKEYQSIFVDKESIAPTCIYFEACKNVLGAINAFTAFPNPTEDELQLSFTLSEDRIIDANLYTIGGQLLKNLINKEHLEKGSHTHSAHISDLPPGIYLLVIESDKGDRISQRIIRK